MENGDFEKLINALASIAGRLDRPPGSRVVLSIQVYPSGSGLFDVVGVDSLFGSFNGPHTAAEMLRELIENAK
jgi:hypothetical protein